MSVGNRHPVPSVFRLYEGFCLALPQKKIGRALDGEFHVRVVFVFIHLCARTVYCRTLGTVQHSQLQQTFVGIDRHFSAERVDFFDNLSLCRASDARIARKISYRVQIGCQTQRFFAQARACQSGLASCVPRPYDDDIENEIVFI